MTSSRLGRLAIVDGVHGRTGLAVIFCFALHAPVLAVDGVIEINQAKALQGGVTPGDGAGFPVSLNETGSYRLTSNLDLSEEPTGQNGIVISAGDVTLDLNGFTIFGATVCTGSPVTSCTNTGTGDGVRSTGEANIRVQNGTIRGMPHDGLLVTGSESQIVGVRLISNGRHGLFTLNGIVEGCVAKQNRLDGINTSSSNVRGNTASSNGEDGIDMALGVALQNVASSNGAFGLNTNNIPMGYGLNLFACNNSGGICTNVQQVDTATPHELATNVCGTDTICP